MTHDDTHRSDPARTGTRRTTLVVGAALAVGVAGVAVFGSELVGGGTSTLSASVDDSAQRRADAVAAVEADVAPVERVRLDDTEDDDGDTPDDGGVLPTADELGDTVGDVVSTLSEAASEVGACVLDRLPDVFGGDDADPFAEDPCGFLPWVDRVQSELQEVDASDVLPDDVDLSDDLDLSDGSDPWTFDLDRFIPDGLERDTTDLAPDDLTLDDLVLGDVDLPEGFDPDELDLPTLDPSEPGVVERAREFAEEIVDVVRSLPDEVGSRWNDLFD